MKKVALFSFGETVDGYDAPVLNEREIRAAAGMLFLTGIIGFCIVWLTGGLELTRIFVVAFFIDFAIRIFINPMYAPSLILGRLFVANQKPEYVSAAPKRFAWAIGLVLSLYVLTSLVLFGIMTPFNLLVCLTCLTLLFFEAAFGICVGCLLYKLFRKNESSMCSGNACLPKKREKIQKVSLAHIVTLGVFLLALYVIYPHVQIDFGTTIFNDAKEEVTEEDCIPPQWAIDIGHEEIYKIHQGCE